MNKNNVLVLAASALLAMGGTMLAQAASIELYALQSHFVDPAYGDPELPNNLYSINPTGPTATLIGGPIPDPDPQNYIAIADIE